MTKKITFEVSDDQHTTIKVEAAKKGKSIKQLILDALGIK